MGREDRYFTFDSTTQDSSTKENSMPALSGKLRLQI